MAAGVGFRRFAFRLPVRDPADGVEVLLAEQAERAGDDETASQAVPAEPAEQERAQVLDHLDAREEAPGDPGVVHAAVLHRAAVGDADRAADRRSRARAEKAARGAAARRALAG